MLTAPVLQSGVEVAIPKTRSVNQLTEERMVVTIDQEQNVFLQDKPVNVNELPTLLKIPRGRRRRQAHHLSSRRRAGALRRLRLGHGCRQAVPASPTSASSPSRCRSEEDAIDTHLQFSRDDYPEGDKLGVNFAGSLLLHGVIALLIVGWASSFITAASTGAKAPRMPAPSRPPWSRRSLCRRPSARSTPAS